MEADAEVEIFTLTDEDGSASDYAVLTIVDLDGESYAILAPVEQLEADQAELDLYAFHYKEAGEEDVELDAVEDPDLLERIFEIAEEILFDGELDDGEEGEDEDEA